MHNEGIRYPTLNPKIVTFAEEPNGIYNTGVMSGVGALKAAKYFISTGKNPNKTFVVPNSDTMVATERTKLSHKLRAPADKMDIVARVHSTLISKL